MVNNLPISYDYHGNIPINVPFRKIELEDIHIYLDVDTYVGAKTCGQSCSHCRFVNYKKVQKLSFDEKEGVAIYSSLAKQGVNVFPRYTDSFAYDGALMRLYGIARARTYFHGRKEKPTETMEAGEAWTSGKPLLRENYGELLDMARDAGYGTITITFHGLINEDLSIDVSTPYPIKGVMPASNFERALENISSYNAKNTQNDDGRFKGFRVGVGVTIGKHNNNKKFSNSLCRVLQRQRRIGIALQPFF